MTFWDYVSAYPWCGFLVLVYGGALLLVTALMITAAVIYRKGDEDE